MLRVILTSHLVLNVCVCDWCYVIHVYNSHNVLIDDNGRALLTDFGLSKTESTISASATTKSLFTGGTLAWTAPEVMNGVKGQSSTQLFTAKSDVYSYGIVTFEVLSGDYPIASYRGAEMSNIPWHGMGMIDIITSVARGIRPTVAVAAIAETNVIKAELHIVTMQQCLHSDPTVRPSFAELNLQLTTA
jgi:serine/threonine protein kinase